MGKIRMGRWDCTVCGFVGNLGPQTHCKSCGSPRDKNVKFYLPENAPEVTDPQLLLEARAGSDWICDCCGSGNKASNKVCYACGNEYDTTHDKNLVRKEFDLSNTPKTSEDITKTRQEERRKNTEQAYQQTGVKNDTITGKRIFIIGGGIIVFIILIASLLIYGRIMDKGRDIGWDLATTGIKNLVNNADNFRQKSENIEIRTSVTITGFAWKRTIYVENLNDVQHEGYSVPSGSRYVSQREVIDHYDKVPNGTVTKYRTVREKTGTRTYHCGTIDHGNGYFEDKECTEDVYTSKQEAYEETVYKDVPVYRTQYTYLTPEWQTVDPVITQENTHVPFWGNARVGSRRRETKREENYILKFRDTYGRPQQDDASFAFWHRCQPAQKLDVRQKLLDEKPVSLISQFP
jgi:hypothetical protein